MTMEQKLMIDPLTSLAFSIYSGKGVYALLLGSGISRSAEIPTGWEVTLDLVRKVAAVKQLDPEPDPALWYLNETGLEPDYSDLLEELAKTAPERANALTAYFEATPEERQEGKKTPTAAHRAIARLAVQGYFRVLLTTNFDRLMEQALEAEGISPSVISSDDMIRGAAPLVHAPVTLIKLHGDYRDSRIRNTQAELNEYTPSLDQLLDRVFDEYGLITVGWSATWDHALRKALLRSPNRRYSTYWAVRGDLSVEGKDLAAARAAELIPIETADTFLTAIETKVEALSAFDKPHPLSIPIAVASAKRYLAEDRYRIELRDLLFGEAERTIATFSLLPPEPRANRENIPARLTSYEQGLDLLVHVAATAGFYGKMGHVRPLLDLVVRFGCLAKFRTGINTVFLQLALWPSCLLFYVVGLAALAAGEFETIHALLRYTTERPLHFEKQELSLYRQLYPSGIVQPDWLTPEGQRRSGVPASDRIAQVLREPLRAFLPTQSAYEDTFDEFEYLIALYYANEEIKKLGTGPHWIPWGRFMFRGRSFGAMMDGHVVKRVDRKLADLQNAWPPIVAKLFDTVEEATKSHEHIKNEQMPRLPFN